MPGAGKKMPLELGNSRRLQPHPLFCLLYPHRAELDFKRGTAFDDRLNDGLSGATFMHVRDQIAINLNSVRLEVGQQLQPGKTGTKVIDRHADTRAF